MYLRQSTSQVIRFGPFLDSTDGVTPETGLTIAQADMQLSKDGAAFVQKNAAGNATHDVDGWYSTTLDATDTATTGIIEMQVNVAGSLPVWKTFFVLTVTAYDSLQSDTINNVAATDIVSAGAIITLSGAVVNVDLVDTTTANTDMRGTDSAATAVNLAIVDSNVDAILVDTSTTIPAQITGLNDFNPTTDAVSNVTLVATTTTNTDMVGTNNALLAASYTAPDNTSITSILADTNELQLNQGDWLTATGFSTSAEVSALNNISVSDIFTGQMTESYAADGVAPTLAQAIFLTMQNLQDFSFSSTTQTVKKLDGSTTAATYTLDDETAPTSKTRAT